MERNNKRSKRRYINYLKAKKQLNLLKMYDTVPDKLVIGKYKKQNALNCGRAACCMCTNPRRISGYLTLKEILADLNYKENLEEV